MQEHSPWGLIQSSRELVPGITRVSTASHGGLHLSPERMSHLQSLFPQFRSWTNEWDWLEEDCDALIAYVAFSDLPCDFDLTEAWEYFRTYQPDVYPSGEVLLKKRNSDTRGVI